jgi:hypothetical protein
MTRREGHRRGKLIEAADFEHFDAERGGRKIAHFAACAGGLRGTQVIPGEAADACAAVGRVKGPPHLVVRPAGRLRVDDLHVGAKQRVRHWLPPVVADALNLPAVVVEAPRLRMRVRRRWRRCPRPRLALGRRLLLLRQPSAHRQGLLGVTWWLRVEIGRGTM